MRFLIFLLIAFGVYYVLNYLFGKNTPTVRDTRNNIFGFVSVIILFGLIFGTEYWGTKVPGSFFERADYDAMVYVNLYPNAKYTVHGEFLDVSFSKDDFYHVPALISASKETDSDGRGYKIYIIFYAIFSNGRKITFDNANPYLRVGKIVEGKDDRGRLWGIELTDNIVRK